MNSNMDTDKIFEIIDKLRKEKGMSLYELAKNAGINSATLYKWRSNKSTPSMFLIESLCETLGADYPKILDDASPRIACNPLSEKEREVLLLWQTLDQNGRQKVMKLIDSLKEPPKRP